MIGLSYGIALPMIQSSGKRERAHAGRCVPTAVPRVLDYLAERDQLFVFRGFVGQISPFHAHQVVNEYAWQNLFARQLFVRPQGESLQGFAPEFTVIAVPGLKVDPAEMGTNSEAFIVISFAERIVLIGGTAYAGEIKKSIFSVMNYLLPQKGILSMHCSANVGAEGDTALFFGLSGTGKTTLSTVRPPANWR